MHFWAYDTIHTPLGQITSHLFLFYILPCGSGTPSVYGLRVLDEVQVVHVLVRASPSKRTVVGSSSTRGSFFL